MSKPSTSFIIIIVISGWKILFLKDRKKVRTADRWTEKQIKLTLVSQPGREDWFLKATSIPHFTSSQHHWKVGTGFFFVHLGAAEQGNVYENKHITSNCKILL